jgi:hypothetical protein
MQLSTVPDKKYGIICFWKRYDRFETSYVFSGNELDPLVDAEQNSKHQSRTLSGYRYPTETIVCVGKDGILVTQVFVFNDHEGRTAFMKDLKLNYEQ